MTDVKWKPACETRFSTWMEQNKKTFFIHNDINIQNIHFLRIYKGFLIYYDDIKRCIDDRQWWLERARDSQFCAHALSAITATNLCSYAEFPSGEPKHNCHNRKSYSTFMALYSLPTNVFAKNLREMKYPIISHFSQFVI